MSDATAAARVQTRARLSDDDAELAYLCGIAWERRGDPAELRAACEAIVDWHDRRHVRAYERRQRAREAALQLLKETAP